MGACFLKAWNSRKNFRVKRQFSAAQELGVYNLIEHYRDYGHLKANLDPLKLAESEMELF